jgi:hypothetical protein
MRDKLCSSNGGSDKSGVVLEYLRNIKIRIYGPFKSLG